MLDLHHPENFTLFLLLHMGCVDGSLHPNERDTILEKMKELFPNKGLTNEMLHDAEREYHQLKPGVAGELLSAGIQEHAALDGEQRKKIFASLFDIINANGRINEEETDTLRVVKSWLTA